ncbi:MAG: hypothetical protein WC294_02070 [Methanoregula sp.]|jgi:hypothetical protein
MVHQPSFPDDKDTLHTQNHADAALFIDLTCWREQLARSIARNNLGMRSELIVTAVNRIIFSLLFLLIAEDRGLISRMLRNIQESFRCDHDLRPILRYTYALYHDDLDISHEVTDDLEGLVLDDQVFNSILSTLTSADRQYDLASMPTETLAQVFLRYLTRTVRRSAAHQAIIVDTHDTTSSGATTVLPFPVIEYLVKSSITAVWENRSAREILPIRVLDPSCGAGRILLSVYGHILEKNGSGVLTFDERREILTGSIHGLDINRHAVAVTRMLLFFRLLEECQTGQNPHSFFKLSELVFSDLRHTIQCGNALISPEIIDDESWMFCPPRERHTLNTFDWHNGFPEIFATGGFDAVVSNPPEGQLKDREWIQQYFQRHYQVYHPLADLSAFVIEKGLSLLRTGGTLSCFLSNRWLRGSSGSPLRVLIGTKQIDEIVDFSLPDKTKPGIAPCILRISNRSPIYVFSATLADISFSGELDEYIHSHRFPVNQALLDDGGWTLSDTRARNILENVCRNGAPLDDFVMGQVHVGIRIPEDDPLVIEGVLAREWLRRDRRCKSLLRPLIAGREISRYHAGSGGKFIILIPQGWTRSHQKAGKKPWQWLKHRHPLIARHLQSLAESLKARHGTDGLWWESACEEFWQERRKKILFPARFSQPAFWFDDGRGIGDEATNAIPSAGLYLAGILNSRLMVFVFDHSIRKLLPDQKIFTWDDLRQLPIYTIDFDKPEDKTRHDRMVTLVTEMLELHKHLSNAKTDQEKWLITQEIQSTEWQIDSLVYGLYGLTADEIETIEEYG